MNDDPNGWIDTGRGRPPRVAWTFGTDAPLTGFSQSRETGESLVADEANGLVLLDRTGRARSLSRGFHYLSKIAWSDGGLGVVAMDGTRCCMIDAKLKEVWSLDFSSEIRNVAITPHGGHVAVALESSMCVVHDAQANRVARFETPRPVHHVAFVPERPEIVLAADYGFVACCRLDGTEVWRESVLTNTGDLDVSGDGDQLLVAAYNRGIVSYSGDSGGTRATFAVEGTPYRVSMSYDGRYVAATTVEGHLYWITIDGDLKWGAEIPEPVASLRTSPLGDGLTVAFESGRVSKLTWGK